MKIDTTQLTIRTAHQHLRNGDFSAVDLAQACLDCIEKKDKEIHAYLEVFDDVLTQAKEADKRIAKKENILPLTGIPVAIKDNMLIKDRIASAGSKILENHHAAYDATVIKKLKEVGAIFIGRTNLDEFAMGSSTENSAYGVTKNPHDLSRVPGGSSGGSAAAVAYGGALGALGSDTGGSIRQPASFCGVVGLKPTYGAVSRSGLIALGSSLDQIGPLTKTVGDAELLFDVLKGSDSLDSTSLPARQADGRQDLPDNTQQKNKSTKAITLGVPRHFFEDGIDRDVLDLFERAVEKYARIGYVIKDIELPRIKHSLAVYYIIMPAEASTNLSRYDGIRYGLHKEGVDLLGDYRQTRGAGFGKEVRRRIILGTYVLSAGYYESYYGKACAARAIITEDFKQAFGTGLDSVDAIMTPTAPTPAFKIGEKENPLSMYLSDIFTVPANIAGIPGLSVPAGNVTREGVDLPVGLQILGPHGEEARLFQIGKDFLDEA